ncbi:MAG: hypothetical protein LBQ75_01395 [Zoogloeaceae bacterium]|jgi:hypothetical protein|nr:hypothetical protein [Zoogloeaceae bacterium]
MKTKPRWTIEEEQVLNEHYVNSTIEALAEQLGRTKNAVASHAKALGLTGKKRDFVFKWTEEEIAYLQANYKRTPKAEICKRVRKGINSVYFKALELGLVRRMRAIKKENQVRCAIILDVKDREFAREIGQGNVSEGIRIALKHLAEKGKV